MWLMTWRSACDTGQDWPKCKWPTWLKYYWFYSAYWKVVELYIQLYIYVCVMYGMSLLILAYPCCLILNTLNRYKSNSSCGEIQLRGVRLTVCNTLNKSSSLRSNNCWWILYTNKYKTYILIYITVWYKLFTTCFVYCCWSGEQKVSL